MNTATCVISRKYCFNIIKNELANQVMFAEGEKFDVFDNDELVGVLVENGLVKENRFLNYSWAKVTVHLISKDLGSINYKED